MSKRQPCSDCGKLTTARDHWQTDIPRCPTCRKQVRTITAGRAKEQYCATEAILATLPCHEVNNPHFKRAAPMRLYRLLDVLHATHEEGDLEPEFLAEIHQRGELDEVAPSKRERDKRREYAKWKAEMEKQEIEEEE